MVSGRRDSERILRPRPQNVQRCQKKLAKLIDSDVESDEDIKS